MKEEALKKSEQMLEEDAIRFDTFLKENDKKAHEAIKKAEKETKLKTDKVQEIKRLNQQIQMVSSDMSKHKEALEDCLKYKEFLDSLTPDEWFSEQKAIKRERQESRRQARIQKRRDALEKKRREAYEAQLRLEEAEAAPKKKYGAGRRRKSVAGADPSKAVAPKMPPPVATPELEDEPLTSSDEELPMYFKHPQQLLDIFSQLEEQNLFLIQNSQETEKALEELKQNFEATKEQMDGKTALLKQNIDELELQIGAEENKAAQLRGRLQARAGETQGRQEKLLAQLHEKVRDVYQKCGFDVGSKPSTLFMLSELEARLEQLLDHIETMSEEYIMKEEKDKEKKRRERKRQEQQALQDAQQEERNRKSIARSMQAPKKRTGRQVMFRSAPMRQAVREEKEEEEDDLDELKYLT
ncbi:coiled-coil domain [Aureococcus anophagefferens]